MFLKLFLDIGLICLEKFYKLKRTKFYFLIFNLFNHFKAFKMPFISLLIIDFKRNFIEKKRKLEK